MLCREFETVFEKRKNETGRPLLEDARTAGSRKLKPEEMS
jgi:hypothetical protein